MGRGKALSREELAAIEDAFERGVGPARFVKHRPGQEFTIGGVKKVMEKLDMALALAGRADGGPSLSITPRQTELC